MSDSSPKKNQRTRNAIQRVVEVARRGQARYRQGTAALGTWLRSHLFRQGEKGWRTQVGRSLQQALAVRCPRERQRVYYSGGGGRSSMAAQALCRVTEAVRQKNT